MRDYQQVLRAFLSCSDLMRVVSDNGSAGPKAASVLISASARSQWATALPFGLPSCSQIKKAASEWPVVPDGS
jgi:hypothetical protein